MASFALSLAAFCRKKNDKLEEDVRQIVSMLAAEIVELSPVGDAVYWKSKPPKGYTGGHFRANWDYGFNQIPSAQYDTIDPSGNSSLARIDQGMSANKMGGAIHYIVNNLPYAQRIEEGWSWHQAPQGVVGLASIKFASIVGATVRGG